MIPAASTYVHTFFRELSPVWLNYVAASRGVAGCPLDQPFTYMELGCGFGHSTVVNAGAFPQAEFHACDFNPEHIAAARDQAAAWGLRNLQLHACSFEELPVAALPKFDFIVLHGVYSWVAESVRATVRAFIDAQLKPGGLVYVSYNCMPGWSIELPLQRLLSELAAQDSQDVNRSAAGAARQLQQLSTSNLAYFNMHPLARGVVDSYVSKPPEYLVHEFLSQSCEAFYSVDVTEQMGQLGLQFIGSATLTDNHPSLVMSESAIEAIRALPTPRQQQLADDFATNRAFRRDVFGRIAPRSPARDAHALSSVIIGCIDPELIASKVRVPQGMLRFQDSFVAAVQAMMHEGCIGLTEAVTALAAHGHDRGEIARNLLYLLATSVLTPFARTHRNPECSGSLQASSDLVERALDYAVARHSACVLPSSALGNGVELEPLEALSVKVLLNCGGNLDSLSTALKTSLQQRGYKSDAQALAQRTIQKTLPRLVRSGLVRGAGVK